jgi:hypothetical protein
MLALLGRGFWCLPRKSGGPPLFAPSLQVQGNDSHNNSGFFGVFDALDHQTTSRSRANGAGRKCVPNENGADFPQVLESDHTIAVLKTLPRQCRACRASWMADSLARAAGTWQHVAEPPPTGLPGAGEGPTNRLATSSQPYRATLRSMATRAHHGEGLGMTARKRRSDLLEVWLELFEKIEGPRRRRAVELRRRRNNPVRRGPNRSAQTRAFGSFR